MKLCRAVVLQDAQGVHVKIAHDGHDARTAPSSGLKFDSRRDFVMKCLSYDEVVVPAETQSADMIYTDEAYCVMVAYKSARPDGTWQVPAIMNEHNVNLLPFYQNQWICSNIFLIHGLDGNNIWQGRYGVWLRKDDGADGTVEKYNFVNIFPHDVRCRLVRLR